MNRSQTESILDDLKKKMVFLAGPRPAGKTWLACINWKKKIGSGYEPAPTYCSENKGLSGSVAHFTSIDFLRFRHE